MVYYETGSHLLGLILQYSVASYLLIVSTPTYSRSNVWHVWVSIRIITLISLHKGRKLIGVFIFLWMV